MTVSNNKFRIVIDGKDYTKYTVFPIKWEKLLDERLDQLRLSLKRVPTSIFAPLTPLSVIMTDKKGKQIQLDTVVATDESAELPVGNGTFNHEIMCLEETKILEGIVVDALTFTNDLGRNYIANAKPIEIEQDTVSIDNDFNYINQQLLSEISITGSPKAIDKIFTFPSLAQIFSPYKNHPTSSAHTIMKWQKESMTVMLNGVYEHNYSKRLTNTPWGDGKDINSEAYSCFLEEGIYDVVYKINFKYDGAALDDFYTEVKFSFSVISNYDPLPRWNIASVIDRVLDVAETHLVDVQPRFALNGKPQNGEAASGQYAEFEQIEAPEFAFTNCTLKEILDQIGGYIHGVPRLRGNTIYFDMLGGTEQAKIADPKYAYISNMYAQDVESYCTSLDSTVDNLVCLTDRAQGTIVDPYLYGDGKSLRTEELYARVEEGKAFISTKYPIQEIVRVECTNIPGHDMSDVDITPYVFEAAEYARMSSYTGNYPTSRVFAIYYTQGQKNIQGLFFKQDEMFAEIKEYAIIRILEKAGGISIDTNYFAYQKLAFRVSYIPIFSARTQQTKQCIEGYKQPRTLIYNQGANLVETRYYGENMKGAVARMGNVDRVVTYNLADFSLIPEMGEMYGDDYYISGVACEMYPALIKCMLTLSQDFNRLSQYIGINSVQRFYEVSEKQAYRRNIKYADYIVIGDQVEKDDTILGGVLSVKTQICGQSETTTDNPTCVIVRGFDEDGNELPNNVNLPVVSTAQGNAMVFTFSYEDNYSAGNMVQPESNGKATGYFTNAVQYPDYYGRLHSMLFYMMHEGWSGESLALPLDRKGISHAKSTDIFTPEWLLVKKDGAEILSVNYVVEFVTNKRNFVLGALLTQESPLVKPIQPDTRKIFGLYVLKKTIGKFSNFVDMEDAERVWYFSEYFTHMSNEGASWKFDDFTPTIDGEAWAICTSRGELLFGSNEPITAGQTVSMPYITARHDIFNLGGNNQ